MVTCDRAIHDMRRSTLALAGTGANIVRLLCRHVAPVERRAIVGFVSEWNHWLPAVRYGLRSANCGPCRCQTGHPEAKVRYLQ
jgi:hypothetical protein